jgi:hypothetical protein
MVKHIYRGYEYDADRKIAELRNQGERRHADLVYRGVHHESGKNAQQDGITQAPSPMWYRGYRTV